MKTKSILLALLMQFFVLAASAYDFKIDNIYYTITDKSASFVSVVSGDTKYAGDITIPTTVTHDGVTYTVMGIGNSAFAECNGLFSVTLNNRIRVIPSQAFSNCQNLETVVLGNKVEGIEYRAFYNCSSRGGSFSGLHQPDEGCNRKECTEHGWQRVCGLHQY